MKVFLYLIGFNVLSGLSFYLHKPSSFYLTLHILAGIIGLLGVGGLLFKKMETKPIPNQFGPKYGLFPIYCQGSFSVTFYCGDTLYRWETAKKPKFFEGTTDGNH